VIGEPPVLDGAAHVTAALASPARATTAVGAEGAVGPGGGSTASVDCCTALGDASTFPTPSLADTAKP
jgi:hypothetical protein